MDPDELLARQLQEEEMQQQQRNNSNHHHHHHQQQQQQQREFLGRLNSGLETMTKFEDEMPRAMALSVVPIEELEKRTRERGLKAQVTSGGGGFGAFGKKPEKKDNEDDETSEKNRTEEGGGGGAPVFGAVFGGSKIANDSEKKETETTTTSNGEGSKEETEGEEEENKKEFKVAKEMKEIEQQTGEEDEDLMFKTDGALYEYVSTEEDGKAPGWRERGRGEFRINSTKKKDNVRMIMRTKGNFRLILNASMFKGQKFAKMEGGKGVTFPCVNAASENKKMTTYALKMRVAQSSAAQQVDTFLEQIAKALLIAGGEESKKED